jgi:hypothetical protein
VSGGFTRWLAAAQGPLGPARVRVQAAAPTVPWGDAPAPEPLAVHEARPAAVSAAPVASSQAAAVAQPVPRNAQALPVKPLQPAPRPLQAPREHDGAPLPAPAAAAPGTASPPVLDTTPPAPPLARRAPIAASVPLPASAEPPRALLPLAEAAHDAVAPQGTSSPLRRATEARRTSRAAPAATSPLGAESEPEPTVVHVSIGRVELVAAPAPAATRPRTSPRASPRLSLADYLGGKSR